MVDWESNESTSAYQYLREKVYFNQKTLKTLFFFIQFRSNILKCQKADVLGFPMAPYTVDIEKYKLSYFPLIEAFVAMQTLRPLQKRSQILIMSEWIRLLADQLLIPFILMISMIATRVLFENHSNQGYSKLRAMRNALNSRKISTLLLNSFCGQVIWSSKYSKQIFIRIVMAAGVFFHTFNLRFWSCQVSSGQV